MKKKDSVPAQSTGAAESAVETGFSRNDKLWLAVFMVMLLGAATVTTGRATLVVMAAAFIFSVRKSAFDTLREHLSLPVFGFLAMILMTVLAAIYSPFEGSAASACYIALSALVMGAFVLLRYRKEHVQVLLWGIMGISALMSLMAVDLASFTKLVDVFQWCITSLGVAFEMETGNASRLNGLFNNANVGASLAALGMLVGLYKIHAEEKMPARLAAALLLGINAMYFWMSLSRGAVLCFGVSLIVYLVAAGKGNRIKLFTLMLVCVVSTVVLSAVATPFLGTTSILPDLLCLLCGVVIFLLDSLLSQRVAAVLEGRGKIIAAAGAVVAVLCAVAVGLALNLTNPYTFVSDGGFSRSVSLKPGEYTVSGDWDEGVGMSVYVEADKAALLMDQGDVVYSGPLTPGIALTIPEGAKYVRLDFVGSAGQTISNVEFSDGTKVKLDYTLLPSTLADRLQDSLLTSSSTLLRAQYMIDALKIFVTSPIYGRGLGSTEGLYTSVQPIYYMSMFVHNHLLQYMCDMGLLGLASFLMIVLGLAWLLIRRLRQGPDALAAMFVACLVMMNLHGLMELIFSVRGYLVCAMTLMAIMTLAYGEPLLLKGKESVKKATVFAAVACWIMLAVFGVMLESYRLVQLQSSKLKTTDFDEFMTTLERYITLDAFCDEYHKAVYIANGNGKTEYQAQTNQYAAALRRTKTYTYCTAVAEYYYLPQGNLNEMFACSREGIAQKAADKDSWNFQFEFYRDTVLPALTPSFMEIYLTGVLETRDYLTEYSVGRLEEIEVTEENQQFLEEIDNVYKQGMSNEEAYTYLMSLYHPDILAQELQEAQEAAE